jgi:predicted 3-demethylubiquinone-9 3-methyltransferase (glyoxalase superfamily)
MPIMKQRISPCLWFDSQAEEAARYYVGIFPNSQVTGISHYGNEGQEITGGKPGSVMLVTFDLDGQSFTALNGGPLFTFNEAVSLQVFCSTQEEIDHYWDRLGQGGDPKAQQCGWLKDRFGVSWQVTPHMEEFFAHPPGTAAGERAMAALLTMHKIDLAALRRAASLEP